MYISNSILNDPAISELESQLTTSSHLQSRRKRNFLPRHDFPPLSRPNLKIHVSRTHHRATMIPRAPPPEVSKISPSRCTFPLLRETLSQPACARLSISAGRRERPTRSRRRGQRESARERQRVLASSQDESCSGSPWQQQQQQQPGSLGGGPRSDR